MIVIHMISRFFFDGKPDFPGPGGPGRPCVARGAGLHRHVDGNAAGGLWGRLASAAQSNGATGAQPGQWRGGRDGFFGAWIKDLQENLKDLYIFWLWVDFVKNWLNSGFDGFSWFKVMKFLQLAKQTWWFDKQNLG